MAIQVQVNNLKKGERFKLHPGDKQIYVRGDYVFKENKYACSILGKNYRVDFFEGKKLVYKVSVALPGNTTEG